METRFNAYLTERLPQVTQEQIDYVNESINTVGPKEKVIAECSDLEKRLFTLFRLIQIEELRATVMGALGPLLKKIESGDITELVPFAKAAVELNPRNNPDVVRLAKLAELTQETFWFEVRERLRLQNVADIGVRRDWKVVDIPEEEEVEMVDVPDDLKTLIADTLRNKRKFGSD